jgi:hypothetical protein
VAALATALGRPPDLVVGKPAPSLFEQTVRRYGAQQPLVIGDRLDTDIEGAQRAGLDSLLVLTGASRPADLLTAPPIQRPTYVANDLSGLFTVDGGVAIGTPAKDWQVERNGDRLQLAGAGDPLSALRALCVTAWAGGDSKTWNLGANDSDAAKALQELGLEPSAS